MFLVAAATEIEMTPIRQILACRRDWQALITGVGCLETAAVLSNFLRGPHGAAITRVINFGVAGAFVDTGVGLLDICLAEAEVVADLGICLGDEVQPLPTLVTPPELSLDDDIRRQAELDLTKAAIPCHTGIFATVNSVSGTTVRGNYLRDRWQAICENMEGAAVARICLDFNLPCLEMRCISNMVEDRDPRRWRLDEAISRGAAALQMVTASYNR